MTKTLLLTLENGCDCVVPISRILCAQQVGERHTRITLDGFHQHPPLMVKESPMEIHDKINKGREYHVGGYPG